MNSRVFLFFLATFFYLTSYSQQPNTKVVLGIKPDYLFSIKGKGVRINGVVKDGIANDNKMQKGDTIVAFDKYIISTIYEYKETLDKYTEGDKAKIWYKREGELYHFDVVF